MDIDGQQIKNFATQFEKIEEEIQKVMIGQKSIIRNALICIIAGGNVLLEGLPGLGKTELVKTMGKVLDLSFSRIQFTPDLMPADVVGTNIIVKKTDGSSSFQFQKGPLFANIVLADEVNRATPKTQSALLEAMQEKTATVGNDTHRLPHPFFVLATQNPLEMEGTYPLPEAQMDRFMFKLDVPFPSEDELYQIVEMTTGNNNIEPMTLCTGQEILQMREVAKQVPVASKVGEYAMRLVLSAHPEAQQAKSITKQYVRYGPSPRGAQALMMAARIQALLEGRYNVSFHDIKTIAHPALRHRIFLNFDALSDGITTGQIIDELLRE